MVVVVAQQWLGKVVQPLEQRLLVMAGKVKQGVWVGGCVCVCVCVCVCGRLEAEC